MIDDIDRKLIKILQHNASMSNGELAEQVGASPASVWRRVKAMEDVGLINPPVRLANADLLGCGISVICNIRVVNQLYDSSIAFEEFVQHNPEIVECYSMSGDWDYLLRIVAKDVTDYNDFLMGKLLKHPVVAAASSHFALEKIKFTTALPI